jgi:SAM-dependent methyltransferase
VTTDESWVESAYGADYFQYLSPNADDRETVDMVRLVLGLLKLKQGARILDLCCGAGRHTVNLAASGYRVIGVDLSPAGLRVARKEIASRNVPAHVLCADIRELPFRDDFDAAVSLFTSFGYEMSEDRDEAILGEFCRVLRPGGSLVLDLVNPVLPMLGKEPRVWRPMRGRFVLEERSYNPVTGVSTSVRTVTGGSPSPAPIVTHIRIYTLAEVGRMLGNAGFRIAEIRGDYQSRPYDAMTSPRLIVLATRT